jgi:hypothetical protein
MNPNRIDASAPQGQLWARFFLPIVLFILVFAMAARTPLDSDMWWHLRAGKQTWQTGRPVLVDTFSYTRYGETWINHSWLSQVGMYLVFKARGYLGLGVLVAVLAALSMGLVYAQMEGPPLLRGFVIVLATAVAAVVWSPRPQMASLILFGLVGYLLYLYKWRQANHLWALPPIFMLWSNLHGGYILGLLLILAMIAGEMLNHILGSEGQQVVPWKSIGHLLIWGLASWLVVAINPNGLAMWAIPFRTIQVGVLQDYISEWASPDFHQFVQQPFLWLLFATLAAVGLSRQRLDGKDLVAVVGFGYLALLARRNFGPFAMVAAPVLSRHLSALLESWVARVRPSWFQAKSRLPFLNKLPQSKPLSPGVTKALNALIIGLLALVAVVKVYLVTNPALVDYFERQTFPVEAAQWVKRNQPPGDLFNAYNWGGYLLWNLPGYPVFVDGRTDLYNDELLGEYLEISAGESGAQNLLGAHSVNLVLVEVDSGLSRKLEASQDWRRTFRSDLATVFVRKSPVTRDYFPRYLSYGCAWHHSSVE